MKGLILSEVISPEVIEKDKKQHPIILKTYLNSHSGCWEDCASLGTETFSGLTLILIQGCDAIPKKYGPDVIAAVGPFGIVSIFGGEWNDGVY